VRTARIDIAQSGPAIASESPNEPPASRFGAGHEGEDLTMIKRSLVAGIVCVAMLAAAPGGRVAAQDEQEYRETFTGTLVGIGGSAGGRTASFTLRLTASTSSAAAGRYAHLLKSKGQEALLDQLRGKDVGTFSVEGQTGRDVNFAFVQSTPEGRRVIVLFERWMQLFERRNGTRSEDYPFTYMEFSLDQKGKGTGTFIGAAKVYFDKDDPNTLTVENFATYPLRVVNVESHR
jgi:hypothetical protein